MSDEIIVTNAEPKSQDPIEETMKQIVELNQGATGGQWIYVEGEGTCWKPACNDAMGGAPAQPTTSPPSVLSQLVEWGKSVDIDNLPQNSVLMIKLNVNDPFRVNMLQRAITKQVLEPRIEKLKDKRICILFMESTDDITVMTEEEMNQAGWEKKEKSRIITL